MTDIATNEPFQARAGDTWAWTRTLDDYPASAGWTLKYRFKNAAAGFEIVAAADGDDHAVSITAVTTADYAAGIYSWMAWVEGGSSEKYTVDKGQLEILPDFRGDSAITAFDDRTHARKVLEAIEAVIENRASKDQEEYTILGRTLRRTPIDKLLKLRNLYKAEVEGQAAADRLANGLAPRKIQFRT